MMSTNQIVPITNTKREFFKSGIAIFRLIWQYVFINEKIGGIEMIKNLNIYFFRKFNNLTKF